MAECVILIGLPAAGKTSFASRARTAAQVTGYYFPTDAAAEGFDRLFTVRLIEEERRFEVSPYST